MPEANTCVCHEVVAAMKTWLRYAGRFVVPALLLAGAVGAWLAADTLASVTHTAASGTPARGIASNDLTTPVLSVRRVPDFATGASQQASFALAIASLPPEPGGLSCVSVLVDGVPVFERRSDRALVPSYAQLLVTGHAAMDILGPDFRYETQVLASAAPDLNGRIFDGIYLLGGGDPVLMSYNYALVFRPALSTRTSIEDLAADVAEAGVVRIDGGVIAIERRYDDQRSLPGWPAALTKSGVVGPLTALQLDDGFAERAAANRGIAIPSEQPAVLTAERFADRLNDLDVQVFGTNRVLEADEELPSLVPVAQISSAPMSDIIFQMFAVNDATAGELILKELGVATSAEGSTQAGARAVQQLLQDQGVDLPVPFRDGSGLDPIGGTTCNQLAATADTIPDDHPTIEVLPDYRLPGVFGGRLAHLDLQADLRLVGGVQGNASGFVARTVDDGVRITISSIINRPGGPSANDLVYQEALVEMVDQLRPSINFNGVEPGQ